MWGGGRLYAQRQLEEQYQTIMMMIRTLEQQSRKSQKQEQGCRAKARAAVAAGENERAVIFADQSIKHKTLSLRYLSMACRMELVASMAKSAVATGQMTDGVTAVLRQVSAVSSPLEVIGGIAHFESMFDKLSVVSGTVDRTLGETAGSLNAHEKVQAGELLALLQEESAVNTLEWLPSTMQEMREEMTSSKINM